MNRTNTTKSISDLLPTVMPMPAAINTNTGKAGIDKNSERRQQRNFTPLTTGNQPPTTDNLPKERCRFDMFVRVKIDHHFKFPGGKKEFTMRGDKYEKEDVIKMLKYLLNTVKNHYKQYFLVELYDHSKPANKGEKLILKILNGEVKINLLTEYAAQLKDYHLPEYLSYEIKNL
jgi:hypothetical protein